MIISRTPFRLSFFGGGTDYPAWYLKEGGTVLSTSINKYCYITVRYLPPFFGVKHRIVWSHIETVNFFNEILHPAVRAGLQYMEFDPVKGLEIHHQGDLPARSGIGSSSSFSVGLIHALTALRGQIIGKKELAQKAIYFEQTVMNENVGSQDQMAVTYGGLNRFNFLPSGEIQRQSITIPEKRLEQLQSKLLLFYLGSSRMSSDHAAKIIANVDKKTTQLKRMCCMVDEAIALLQSGSENLDDFGHLLHEAWTMKKEVAGANFNPEVDQVYTAAREAGALGGKLMGAGGTGFMYFYVPDEKQPRVIQALQKCLYVPFRFDRDGSTILHYDVSA